MAYSTRVLLVIVLSMSIHVCYMGSKVVVSLFALNLGASQATVGILAACYAVIPLLLGVYSGRLADTRGMRLPLVIGAIATELALLVGFGWREVPGLFAVAMLMGLGFVFHNVSIQTLAGAISQPDHRTRNFAWLSMGYSLSTLSGPLFAGISIDHWGHANTFAFFAVAPLVALALLAFKGNVMRPRKAPAQAAAGTALDLLRDPPLRRLIIISGLTVASSELFAFYVPVFTHQAGLSATATGVILGSYALAIFVTRFFLGSLVRVLKPNQIMFGFLLFGACAFAVFPLTHNLYVLIAVAFMIGIGMGCTQPLLMSTSYEKSPPGRAGEVTGLRLTANNIARVTMPLAAGMLGAVLGAAPVFWLNAVNLASISWLSRR